MTISEKTVQAVWDKGRGDKRRDPAIWRKDECGAWIRREHLDHRTSEYGWKIEVTVAGGKADIGDLRPFHRDNGFDVNTGERRCKVTSDRDDIRPTAEIDTPHNRNT
jgi:hypothetical protein